MATDIVTKIRPLGDRVVVKPKTREEMTKSGIVLPDTAKEKPQEGKVVAVGPGQLTDDGKRLPIDVKTGQIGPLREVRRQRGQARRRGVPDPARERRPRRARLA